ncbi:MAG: DUF2279 domain-containing protein [Bacteroidia bacterium]
MWPRIFLLLFFALRFFNAGAFSSENDTTTNRRSGKIIFLSTEGAVAAGSLVYLNQQWYKPYATEEFHLFNDDNEWLQMDKCGHAFTTYNTARFLMQSANRIGFTRGQSRMIGGWSAFGYMAAIEFMDGFSSGWGFSWGDMAANFGGTMLAVSQDAFWNEQRISLKFSFHQSRYAAYRPNLLGNTLSEQILKDYNGQTYWFSINISSFLKKENKFPKWINIALGYGAEGMVSGDNNYTISLANGEIIGNNRYRKYLLSLDVDLTKIQTKSRFLKNVFSVFNCFKVPFPALEFNKNGIAGHALFY